MSVRSWVTIAGTHLVGLRAVGELGLPLKTKTTEN